MTSTDNTTKGASIIGRFGLKADPRGAHAIFTLLGRDYIVSISSVYREESRGCWMVTTRHLCGDDGPTVALGFVSLLNRF